MPNERVNYDPIAPLYDQRYTVRKLKGVAAALRSLAQNGSAGRVLEVGCGTGRWLAEMRSVVPRAYGLDLSLGMLRQARRGKELLDLICGQASQLPFPDAVFDLIFCVNAFHHFDQPRVFVSEARRLLRPDGVLAIIGMNPHADQDHWYLYHYFEGTREADLGRFPSGGAIVDWMIAAGFERVAWRRVERIVHQHVGREVLEDHFLQKNGTSQLALLTDEAYALGLARIEAALREAEVAGNTLIFPVDISLTMLTAS